MRRSRWHRENDRPLDQVPSRGDAPFAPEAATWGTVIALGLKAIWSRLWPRKAPKQYGEMSGKLTAPSGMGLASLLGALDWEHVRAEVDRESRAHVVLIGARGAGKSTLMHLLKGFDPEENSAEETNAQDTTLTNLGFFALADLPAASPNGDLNASHPLWFELESADLIVWILDGAAGLRGWEHEWISRMRALGKPLLVVLNKLDALPASADLERWQRMLGCEMVTIAAREGTNVQEYLLPRMADTSPQLATALGREVPVWRRAAAERVMQRAAMLSGLTGLEPVPLLDIPFQIYIQLQMVLRLASIYGQPLNDRYSREMLATMVGGVALRYGGQQLLKIIPFLGWLASGALAGGGTWVIGRLAVEYFENGRRVRPDLTGFRPTPFRFGGASQKPVRSVRKEVDDE